MSRPADSYANKNLKRLVNQLGSMFKREREQAYAELSKAPAERVRPLLLLRLKRDLRRTTRTWVLIPVAVTLLVSSLSSIAILSRRRSEYRGTPASSGQKYSDYDRLRESTELQQYTRQRRVDNLVESLDGMLPLSMIGIYGLSYGVYLRRYRRAWGAAGLLALQDDPRIVGSLTELIYRPPIGLQEDPASDLRASVKTAWIRMMPNVSIEAVNSLNTKQPLSLHTDLNNIAEPGYMSGEQCKTAIAIMMYIAAIGDLDARPIVERISGWKNISDSEQAVSVQARKTLHALDLIKVQSRTGAVLLRSSSDLGKQSKTMLRATNEVGDVEAAELLRADQVPASDAAPVFIVMSNAVKPEAEDVLEVRIGG